MAGGYWLTGALAILVALAPACAAAGSDGDIEAMVRAVTLAQGGRANRFVAESRLLGEGLAAHCDGAPATTSLGAAQVQWRRTVSAWDGLAALAAGPLLQRHSASRIDFRPLRPALLEQAIAAQPATEAEMEGISAAARGFQALEALLWPGPLEPGSPRCAYAVALAADVEREAQALEDAYARELATPPSAEAAKAGFDEIFNRWLGGMDQLRWSFMRKPIEVARSFGGQPEYPRRLSGQACATWAARWATLRDVAVLRVPTAAAPVSLETLLRLRGMNPLADRLAALTVRADRAMTALKADDAARVRAASLHLGALSAFAQQALAPVLGVRLEFNDSDGD